MKSFQLALLTICVIGTSLARPEGESGDSPPATGGDHAKWHEKHKKHIKCAIETQNLTTCCPLPKYDELNNDAECKALLEGIETKDNKEKGKASVCFIECIFKKNKLVDGKEVKWDKIRELNTKLMESDNDFKDISAKAIDFCEAKGKEVKEKFKNFKGGPNKHHQHHNKDGQKRCGIVPAIISGCVQGYIVRSCPEAKWTRTDECNTLKSNAKTIEECTSN
ncbi:hypothetical protein PVAND_005261 [Polypedilum vanderplanki]|uniref:OBP47-like domain-containing protein n=1 Tax=Polypedilum vanderplanki TaxID=319348 RepID=A0A9J6C0B3_POLVA|nr:hypothetical protein PVAND_005261 [Polypedilum vanderplanki]